MTTISVLKLMPADKESVGAFFQQTKSHIMSGKVDPIEVAILLRGMEDVIKKLRTDKDIDNLIIDEVSKSGKEVVRNGIRLTVKETGVKYDYSVCNDSVLNEINQRHAEVTAEKKARETILEAHREPWANIDTGEEINPPIKMSTTKVTVTL